MVTFFTSCYENDWRELIINGGIKRKIDSCNYHFAQKIIIVNNVNNKKVVKQALNELIEDEIISNYYFADEFSELILLFFNIDINSFNGGYWYSIAPLLAIYVCNTTYMVYFTGDAICENTEYNWIDNGIEALQKNDKIKVVNPIWNCKHDEAKKEQDFYTNIYKLNNELLDWHLGCSFSDQCFLIKTNEFIGEIYNEENDLSNVLYPTYAGNSFEKRVSSYLKNNQYLRLTSKHSSYKHPIL